MVPSGGSNSGSGGSADPPGLVWKPKWPLFGHVPIRISFDSFETELIGIGKDLVNDVL